MLSPFFSFMNFYLYYVKLFNVYINYNFVIHTQFFGLLALFTIFVIVIYRVKKVLSSFSIHVFQNIYYTMYDIILGSLGNNGIVFIAFLFFFWMFIFFFNLVGLLPFAFTIGSHFSITICFSIIAWMGSLILVIESEGVEYFEHFYIESINFYLATFISLIELISYIFRAISLALRLFANLVAGHVLLHLCGALVISNMEWDSPFNLVYVIQSILLLCVFTFLFSFELVISFVQSYVFLLLTCIYLQDTVNAYQKNAYYFSTKSLKAKAYVLNTKEYINDITVQLLKERLTYPITKYNMLFNSINIVYDKVINTLYTYFNLKSTKENNIIDGYYNYSIKTLNNKF